MTSQEQIDWIEHKAKQLALSEFFVARNQWASEFFDEIFSMPNTDPKQVGEDGDILTVKGWCPLVPNYWNVCSKYRPISIFLIKQLIMEKYLEIKSILEKES